MLTPFNYADKVAEGVETFFSMQRQTLQMAFGNLERSRISRYESLSQTQISSKTLLKPLGGKFWQINWRSEILSIKRFSWNYLRPQNNGIRCSKTSATVVRMFLSKLIILWWWQKEWRSKAKRQKAQYSSWPSTSWMNILIAFRKTRKSLGTSFGCNNCGGR